MLWFRVQIPLAVLKVWEIVVSGISVNKITKAYSVTYRPQKKGSQWPFGLKAIKPNLFYSLPTASALTELDLPYGWC